MIGYINTTRDTQLKLCTAQIFDTLVNSAMVKTNIEEYRKGADTKCLLPAFLFQGIDPNCMSGKIGSRKQSCLQPTGLYIMDFDHLDSPLAIFDLFKTKIVELGMNWNTDVALIHITPSGKGLRLVLRIPKGMNIQQAQEFTARVMGVEYDAVVKDLSRLSYCPQASDIIYVNKQVLFKDYQPPLPQPSPQATKEGDARKDSPTPQESETQKNFPTHYNGIPYSRLVEELITVHGGVPQVGNREYTLFLIASDLAKVTDRTQAWMEQLLPTFDLPEQEWRNTIAQVCKSHLRHQCRAN